MCKKKKKKKTLELLGMPRRTLMQTLWCNPPWSFWDAGAGVTLISQKSNLLQCGKRRHTRLMEIFGNCSRSPELQERRQPFNTMQTKFCSSVQTYKLTYRIMTCTLEQILPTLWYFSYYEYQMDVWKVEKDKLINFVPIHQQLWHLPHELLDFQNFLKLTKEESRWPLTVSLCIYIFFKSWIW
jgi:hypothetical protein